MRRLIILAVLFSCSSPLLAQTDASSLEKARDYINAKLTYLMLTELLETDKDVKEKWSSVEDILKSNTVENVLSYQVLSKSLAQGYPNTIRKLSGPISRLDVSRYAAASRDIAAQEIVDTALRILEQAYADVYPAVRTHRLVLLDDVLAILPPEVDMPESIQEKEAKPADNNIFRQEEAGFFSLQYVSLWTLLALLSALIAMGLSAIAINKCKDEEKKRRSESRSGQPYDDIYSSYVTDKELQRYKEQTEAKIKEISTSLGTLNLAIRKNDLSGYDTDKQVNTPPVLNQAEDRPDVFYMSSPSNNYFPMSTKSQQKENTLYRFVLMANRNEAQFEVINDGAPVTQAAYHASSYLEPACDAQNSPGGVVNRIVTLKPGKACFDGEKWIINYKAEIRYE